LLLDLYVTPSALFIKNEGGAGEPAAEEGGEEGGAADELLEMKWHCKSGMSENI
jgi:hypothetical protein